MSKALELTVYPRNAIGLYEVPPSVWMAGLGCDPADSYVVHVSSEDIDNRFGPKRLAEAELAAEFEAARCDQMVHRAAGSYWAPVDETWPRDYESAVSRASVLLRLASLPHYDEDEA